MRNNTSNLEEFEDPPNYDIEEADSARTRLPYLLDLVRRCNGPVLELGCGSGLITLPVAEICDDVTAVDLSRPMLDHARAKALSRSLRVTWVEADARTVVLGRRFGLIIVTGHAFQAFLTRMDQRRLLRTVHRHLAVDGRFVFETRNPGGHELIDEPEEEFWFEYWSIAGHRVRVSGTRRYDARRRLMHWTTYRRWTDDVRAHTRESRIACRFTGQEELRSLLGECGFAVDWQHGDWQGGALTPSSEEIITVCRATTRVPKLRGMGRRA